MKTNNHRGRKRFGPLGPVYIQWDGSAWNWACVGTKAYSEGFKTHQKAWKDAKKYQTITLVKARSNHASN